MPATPRHEIVALDGLRAVAVLLVLGYHGVTELAPSRFAGGVGNVLLAFGPYGVTLFFVISGYVIWRPVAAARAERRTPPAAAAFVARRVVRIVPALWLATALQSWWIEESHLRTATDWWINLTMTQSLRHGWELSGIGVAWTLTIEAMFYALVAVVLVVLRSPRVAAAPGVTAVLVGSMVIVGWSVRFGFVVGLGAPVSPLGEWFGASAVPLTMLWWADAFALGMAIAGSQVAQGTAIEWARRREAGWIAVAALLGLLALDATGWARTVTDPVTDVGLVLAVPLRSFVAGVIVLVLVARAAAGPRPLRARPLVWIGTISYGVYLWHLAVLRWIRDLDGAPDSAVVRFGVALAGSMLLGAASWYLLERPLIDVVRRRQRRATAAA